MSYAMINAGQVAKACRSYLNDRQQRQDNKREEMIVWEMARPRFFRTLFGLPSVTREAAKKALEEESFGKYGMITISGGMWAYRVECLLSLAEVSIVSGDGLVRLDSEMAGLLHSRFFLKE
jgi:hypothetical protein